MKGFLFCVIMGALLCSCKGFLYHPDEIRPAVKQLNAGNIQKLSTLPSKTSFKFILIGDTQQFYDELDAFVDHVNSLGDISFVLLNGDLVDFGLNREYNWIASKLGKLKVPYIASIGNHDMLANGPTIFRQMFGPENFTFSYGNSKFICLNTNSREAGNNGTIPDLPWLERQLSDNTTCNNIFILSHIPPFSMDFDRQLEPAFSSLLSANPKTRLSMHGHEHNYRLVTPYAGKLPYLVVGALSRRNYALISVNEERFNVEEKYY